MDWTVPFGEKSLEITKPAWSQAFENHSLSLIYTAPNGRPRPVAEMKSKWTDLLNLVIGKMANELTTADKTHIFSTLTKPESRYIITSLRTFLKADGFFECVEALKTATLLNPELFTELFEHFQIFSEEEGFGSTFFFEDMVQDKFDQIQHKSVLDFIESRGLGPLFTQLAKRLNLLGEDSNPRPSNIFQNERFQYWEEFQQVLNRDFGLNFEMQSLQFLATLALKAIVAEAILETVKTTSTWRGVSVGTEETMDFLTHAKSLFNPIEGLLDDVATALTLHYFESPDNLSPREFLGIISLITTAASSENRISEFKDFLGGKNRTNNSLIQVPLDELTGTQFEEFLKDLFVSLGFEVELTGQHGDQGADLIVTGNGLRTAIQAKRYAEAVGNAAVQEVIAAREFHTCQRAMVITTSSFTPSARELARRAGVELWDRKDLEEKLSRSKAA